MELTFGADAHLVLGVVLEESLDSTAGELETWRVSYSVTVRMTRLFLHFCLVTRPSRSARRSNTVLLPRSEVVEVCIAFARGRAGRDQYVPVSSVYSRSHPWTRRGSYLQASLRTMRLLRLGSRVLRACGFAADTLSLSARHGDDVSRLLLACSRVGMVEC